MNGTWTQLHPKVSPPARAYQSTSFDPKIPGLLMFGGMIARSPTFDTWTFTAGNWTNVTPTLSPYGPYAAMSTYDAAAGNVRLFGGGHCDCGLAYSNQTWTFGYPSSLDVNLSAPYPGAHANSATHTYVFGCTHATGSSLGRPTFRGTTWTAALGATVDVSGCAGSTTAISETRVWLNVTGPRFRADAPVRELVAASWRVTSAASALGTYVGGGRVRFSTEWVIGASVYDLTRKASLGLLSSTSAPYSTTAWGGNMTGVDLNGSSYLNQTKTALFERLVLFWSGDVYVLHWWVEAVVYAIHVHGAGAVDARLNLGSAGNGAVLTSVTVS